MDEKKERIDDSDIYIAYELFIKFIEGETLSESEMKKLNEIGVGL